ncbi:hypothetical protein llap_17077 [Limosa lapponica baueri]|uniref:Uncharacterized protein n=1 Tax=Limosa lapponica baueri TaxID=1758121 RepID=A0A2I0TFR0_LIMLA|nr:hypothetical protein llap_17077 [Limosa lapponica baueri]
MQPYCGVCALLIATLTLSPAATAAQSGNDATGEDVYPPLWDLAPENLLDFPVKDNKIVINAWNYRERLGVYKNLLSSSAKYFTAFGSQNFGNILWGLPLQHGWQFRTGRLADPSRVTSCGYEDGDLLCISVRSWWSSGSPTTFSSFELDDALRLMWRAHVASIAYALPKFQDRYWDERGGQRGIFPPA